MQIDITYLFFKKLEKDIFSFIYQGEFNDDSIGEILRLNDYSIDFVSELPKLKGRISFLMAECFQNISRHEDKPEILNNTNNKPSMFMTRNIGPAYYIGSSNLIDNKKIAPLKKHLENLNTLGKEDLVALHKSLLINNELSEKGGFGLGLVEMARKSGHKLEYHFEFVNYYLSQYYLQLNLQTNKLMEETGILNLADTMAMHQLMIAYQVIMIHKGDFNQESILPILKMLENNLSKKTTALGVQKKVFYLVLELLQNVSKYGLVIKGIREGIFLLCKSGNRYIVSTGNFILNSDIPNVKSILDSIVDLNKDTLEAMHKRKLVDGANSGMKNGGLGLIDVVRFSNDKIQYSFEPVDENKSFYTLQVTI
jgi:hypothetical protein